MSATREGSGSARRGERRKPPRLLAAALALWAVGVGAGFTRLRDYAATAGDSAAAPARWPAGSSLAPDPGRANLVLLAHPRCPCTRASLGELEQILRRCDGRVTAHVLFYRPRAFPEGWERTDLWRRAAARPGVRVRRDPDGADARRFGAATSGQVLLYGADGRLLFHGGITNARGHAGASAGSAAIVALLTGGSAGHARTPVFGCPLAERPAPEPEGTEPCCRGQGNGRAGW